MSGKQTLFKGRLQNPPACWQAVMAGFGRFLLLETMTTARNRTEPPVDPVVGFWSRPLRTCERVGLIFHIVCLFKEVFAPLGLIFEDFVHFLKK